MANAFRKHGRVAENFHRLGILPQSMLRSRVIESAKNGTALCACARWAKPFMIQRKQAILLPSLPKKTCQQPQDTGT